MHLNSHLLEKIRTLGESCKGNEKKSSKSDESEYPEPIKRRLLI